MEKVFSAGWDRTLAIYTVLLATACLGSAVLAMRIALKQPVAPSWVRGLGWLTAISLVGVVIVAALAAPRRYTVGQHGVSVQRWLGSIDIPSATILRVRAISSSQLKGSVRAPGNGGMFGYYGRFNNATLGWYRMYATKSYGHVEVQTVGDRFVLTPDNPSDFIAAVETISNR